MRIGYNAVSRGPRISAARGEMSATANNNAVINCHLFFMKSSCLSCTDVSRNNLIILEIYHRSSTALLSSLFVVPLASALPSAIGTNPIVFQTDLLCN